MCIISRDTTSNLPISDPFSPQYFIRICNLYDFMVSTKSKQDETKTEVYMFILSRILKGDYEFDI